jgi:hypothetical protein
MRKYKATSILLAVWMFMGLTVLDIFQENAIDPTKMWDTFSFVFTTVFCVVTGFLFYYYRNAL